MSKPSNSSLTGASYPTVSHTLNSTLITWPSLTSYVLPSIRRTLLGFGERAGGEQLLRLPPTAA